MSEDEKREELTLMLLRQHSLKKALVCLENNHERMLNQMEAAIIHLRGIRGDEMTELPTASEIRSVFDQLADTRSELERLGGRINAC